MTRLTGSMPRVDPERCTATASRIPGARRRSRSISKELERRKIQGGLILFPDEGRGAAKRGNIVATIGHTIAFFEKHLSAR
jgi:hypothetical protein